MLAQERLQQSNLVTPMSSQMAPNTYRTNNSNMNLPTGNSRAANSSQLTAPHGPGARLPTTESRFESAGGLTYSASAVSEVTSV